MKVNQSHAAPPRPADPIGLKAPGWSYKVVTLQLQTITEDGVFLPVEESLRRQLQPLGADAWELVAIKELPQGSFAIFKRGPA